MDHVLDPVMPLLACEEGASFCLITWSLCNGQIMEYQHINQALSIVEYSSRILNAMYITNIKNLTYRRK